MSNALRINSYQPIVIPERAGSTGPAGSDTQSAAQSSFDNLLATQLEKSGISFSRHAAARLQSRGVTLSPDQMNKISAGIDRAAQKGSKETLVLSDDAAMVVSVKSRTVITVFDTSQLKEGVVTSIDSAVIL